MRTLVLPLLCAAAAVALPTTAHAQKADHARYAAQLGFSPFGGSVNFSFNKNKKNSLTVALGGSPTLGFLTLDIDGAEYELESSTSYIGAFWNHRPFKDADWFRFNVGVAAGQISNTLTRGKNVYTANYREAPVGYMGIGFGNQVKEGFLIGFDLGVLSSAGAEVSDNQGTGEDLRNDRAAIEDSFMFGPILPNGQLTVGWGW